MGYSNEADKTLQRIAEALERIAVVLENRPVRPKPAQDILFPWNELSVRARNLIQDHADDSDTAWRGQPTAKQLIMYGRTNMGGLWRGCGDTCLRELDAVMERLGFSDLWQQS